MNLEDSVRGFEEEATAKKIKKACLTLALPLALTLAPGPDAGKSAWLRPIEGGEREPPIQILRPPVCVLDLRPHP